jgi:hypothetical protein
MTKGPDERGLGKRSLVIAIPDRIREDPKAIQRLVKRVCRKFRDDSTPAPPSVWFPAGRYSEPIKVVAASLERSQA